MVEAKRRAERRQGAVAWDAAVALRFDHEAGLIEELEALEHPLLVPRRAAFAEGEHGDEIKPIIQPGSSDSAALDSVFEVLARAGRSSV